MVFIMLLSNADENLDLALLNFFLVRFYWNTLLLIILNKVNKNIFTYIILYHWMSSIFIVPISLKSFIRPSKNKVYQYSFKKYLLRGPHSSTSFCSGPLISCRCFNLFHTHPSEHHPRPLNRRTTRMNELSFLPASILAPQRFASSVNVADWPLNYVLSVRLGAVVGYRSSQPFSIRENCESQQATGCSIITVQWRWQDTQLGRIGYYLLSHFS